MQNFFFSVWPPVNFAPPIGRGFLSMLIMYHAKPKWDRPRAVSGFDCHWARANQAQEISDACTAAGQRWEVYCFLPCSWTQACWVDSLGDRGEV